MSESTIDDIMGRLNAVVHRTLAEGLNDAADDWRQLIAVPVERSRGRVIRSAPGQPPRRDSGRLQRSIAAVVETLEGDVVKGRLASDTPYDQFLKFGTPRMAPRPSDGPIEAKWERIITNRMAIAVRELSQDI